MNLSGLRTDITFITGRRPSDAEFAQHAARMASTGTTHVTSINGETILLASEHYPTVPDDARGVGV